MDGVYGKPFVSIGQSPCQAQYRRVTPTKCTNLRACVSGKLVRWPTLNFLPDREYNDNLIPVHTQNQLAEIASLTVRKYTIRD